MDFISVGFGYVIEFFNNVSGHFLVALLLFAIAVKVVLSPFNIMQQKNMIKQAKLRPKEMAIRKKYAGRNDRATQEKVQAEIMELYQQEHYSPFSGCLPMLLQFPIIIALYQVVINPIQYLCHYSTTAVNALKLAFGSTDIRDISLIKNFSENLNSLSEANAKALTDTLTAEGITDLSAVSNLNLKIFGGAIDLSDTPSFGINWLVLVPILSFVIAFIVGKLTKKFTYQPTAQPNQGLKFMDILMPLMSLIIAFSVPAAVGIYWIFNNIISFALQVILSKVMPTPVFTDAEYKAAEKQLNAAEKEKKRPQRRSLINDDCGPIVHARPDQLEERKHQPENKSQAQSNNSSVDRANLKSDKNNQDKNN